MCTTPNMQVFSFHSIFLVRHCNIIWASISQIFTNGFPFVIRQWTRIEMQLPISINEMCSKTRITQNLNRSPTINCETYTLIWISKHIFQLLFFIDVKTPTIPSNCNPSRNWKFRLQDTNKKWNPLPQQT